MKAVGGEWDPRWRNIDSCFVLFFSEMSGYQSVRQKCISSGLVLCRKGAGMGGGPDRK